MSEPGSPPPDARRPARPPLLPTLATCAAIVAVALVASVALARTRPTPPRREASQESRLGVRVVEARRRAVRPEVEGLGRARAARRVTVSARTGGLALELHPTLEAGQLLPADAEAVRIDPTDAAALRAQAEARLAGARAERERLVALGAALEERTRVAAELVALERAEVERMRALVGEGVLRDREPDAARLALLRQEDALLALESQRTQLGPQLAAAAAAQAEAEARLETARLDESRCQVRAPFAGLVANRLVEAGQLVAPGQALFELWDVSSVEVPVALTVEQALLFAPGLTPPDGEVSVEVRAELGAGEASWTGRLARLEPVDAATQTVRAVVVVENPPPREASAAGAVAAGIAPPAAAAAPPLLPGLFCRVVLRGPAVGDALLIPLEALQERERVFLAADEALAVREVRLGRRLGRWVEVREGVRDGELVITSAVERPIAGLPLQVVRDAPAEAP